MPVAPTCMRLSFAFQLLNRLIHCILTNLNPLHNQTSDMHAHMLSARACGQVQNGIGEAHMFLAHVFLLTGVPWAEPNGLVYSSLQNYDYLYYKKGKTYPQDYKFAFPP